MILIASKTSIYYQSSHPLMALSTGSLYVTSVSLSLLIVANIMNVPNADFYKI